jgi:hypothetical protein
MSVLGDDGLGRFREEPFPEDGSPPIDVPMDPAPAEPPVLVDVPVDPGLDAGDGTEPPDLGWGPLFEGDPGNPSGDEGAE